MKRFGRWYLKKNSYPILTSKYQALTLAQNRSNEFIVRYHDIFLDREIRSGVELISLCIVMELCDGGDIAIFIEQAAAEKKPIDSQVSHPAQILRDINTINAHSLFSFLRTYLQLDC